MKKLMIAALGFGLAGCGSGSVGGTSTGGGAGAGATASGGGGSAAAGDATGGGAGTVVADSSVGNGGSATGAGGVTGTGGRAPTGAGGASAGTGGASSGTGGSPLPQDGGVHFADAGMTAGCNAASWPAGGTANPQTINVTVNGTTTARQFYFALPANYTSSKPYRVIFAWHYAGGMALTIAGNGGGGRYYGIQPLLPDSFFVAGQGLADPQGPDAQPTTGWPNTNGRDIAFARAMIDWMNTNFCIDTTRVMSTGFSYGAIMSHTVACQMPDVFRAIGVMSGSLIGRATSCVNHNIAAWMTHGTVDDMVAFTSGESARDRIVTLNHCAATTQAVTPSPCVAYDGCDSGYPVVWCPVQDEGHVIPSFGASAIANFFSQF